MNGQALYDLLTSILAGEEIDPTYALQLMNIARLDFEGRRPWQVLKAKDTSQTAAAGNNNTTPLTMPTPATASLTTPYLMRYVQEGTIQLVNSSNVNDVLVLKEVAYENQLLYNGRPFFYGDYANRKFYILANLPHSYTVYQFFVADFGDVALATSWIGFPTRFHPMLAFQAAARYRLGTDYDDIAAKNADQNFQTSEQMLKMMVGWDAAIAQTTANNRSFSATDGGGGFTPPGGSYGSYGVIPQ